MADSLPLIKTARLMMRPFAIDDVDDLHRLWVDPGVRKFLWDDQVIPRETAIVVVESSIESFVNHGFGFWRAKPFNSHPVSISSPSKPIGYGWSIHRGFR
jgi:hypothetical protein